MTASPSAQRRCARTRARRLQPRRLAIVAVLLALLLVALALACAARAADEPVKGEVKVFTDGGYARLVFRFEQEVHGQCPV